MAESQDPKPAAKAPVFYLLNNVTRGRSNRTARAVQPGRVPFVQRFAGGTILVRRARPARITEAALLAHLDEFKEAVAQAKVVVTTLSGRVVNLDTFEVAPAPAEKPLPNPPLDSAKNDKNEGIGYDVPPTPEGTTLNAPEPELVRMAAEHAAEPDQGPAAEEPADATASSMESEAEPELWGKKSKGKGKRG